MSQPEEGTPAARATDDGPDVRQAYLAAVRAGPMPVALRPLSDEELDAPIGSAAPAPGEFPATAAAAAGTIGVDGGGTGGLSGWLAEPPAAPEVLGYACGRLLSTGGQASVFTGVQEATGLRVALKILHGGPYMTAAARRRLDREVRALATVCHPNVARVVDRGRTADGSFFVAMQLIDGRPLDARLTELRAAGDGPALFALFAKIAAALAAAHAAGVVHRDVKPSNVLVDAAGEPHLIDFGLARLLGPGELPDGGRHATVTADGQILGSLPWASPEQADGRSAAVGPAADTYAVGVMLYHAVTGRFPYGVEGPVYEVLDAIRRAVPPPPGASADRWDGVAPAAVDAVVLKALAKDARHRYASAHDLHADLARLAGGLPPVAVLQRVPPLVDATARRVLTPAVPPTGRWWRRGGPFLLVGGAAAVAIAAAVMVPIARPPPRTVTPLLLPTATAPHGIRLVQLPAGQFRMGSVTTEGGRDPAEVQHLVPIPRPLWMSATEVTRGHYAAVIRGDPSALAAADADLPVTGVTHAEAEAFCRALGRLDGHAYRLPDEAEWEYACRAVTPGAYAGTGELGSMGWYRGNRGAAAGPGPVARKQPNAYGLYDMHGNVREWCRDVYVPGYGPPRRTAGKTYHPAVRGGSYARDAAECRSAARGWSVADLPAADLGFRIVRDDAGPAADDRSTTPR